MGWCKTNKKVIDALKKLQEKIVSKTIPQLSASPPPNIHENRKGGRIKNHLFIFPLKKQRGGI
jgi:hypothetical protein